MPCTLCSALSTSRRSELGYAALTTAPASAALTRCQPGLSLDCPDDRWYRSCTVGRWGGGAAKFRRAFKCQWAVQRRQDQKSNGGQTMAETSKSLHDFKQQEPHLGSVVGKEIDAPSQPAARQCRCQPCTPEAAAGRLRGCAGAVHTCTCGRTALNASAQAAASPTGVERPPALLPHNLPQRIHRPSVRRQQARAVLHCRDKPVACQWTAAALQPAAPACSVQWTCTWFCTGGSQSTGGSAGTHPAAVSSQHQAVAG